MDDYAGPLSRFRVIDLARVRSGPTAVRQFADWGADVIKVEAPDAVDKSKGMGGARHGPDFQNIHRNKRGITLNLKKEEGRRILLRLVETADVVVENYRPDVKHRLGIDYDTLKAVNPRIILLSISGFGQDGPYEKRPGFDQIAQGMGGLMWITGLPGQGPVRVGIPVADLTAGMYGAMGVLVALLEREVSGEGQWVQTSLLHSMIAMLDFQAARYLMNGEVPPQAGNNHPTSIPTGVFQTADGFINIAATGGDIFQRMCNALGDEGMRDNPDYQTGEGRSEHRDALNAAIEAHTVTKTSTEWIDILNQAGVPCGPIYKMDEMFADPQVQHVDMAHPIHHPTLGDFNVVAQAVRMSRHEPRTGAPTPERGQHTDEVLREAGYTDDDIAGLRDRGIV